MQTNMRINKWRIECDSYTEIPNPLKWLFNKEGDIYFCHCYKPISYAVWMGENPQYGDLSMEFLQHGTSMSPNVAKIFMDGDVYPIWDGYIFSLDNVQVQAIGWPLHKSYSIYVSAYDRRINQIIQARNMQSIQMANNKLSTIELGTVLRTCTPEDSSLDILMIVISGLRAVS